MAVEEGRSLHERVTSLEEIVADQSAVIDGLKTILADVLAAHAVQNKDIRLARFIAQYRNFDATREGTLHYPKSYFRSRSMFFTDLLNRMYCSQVFEIFWVRSAFWRKEEKQRAHLEKVRKLIDEISESK